MFCLARKIKLVILAQAGIYNKPAKTIVRKAIFLAFWSGALWISAFAEMTFAICLLTTPIEIDLNEIALLRSSKAFVSVSAAFAMQRPQPSRARECGHSADGRGG